MVALETAAAASAITSLVGRINKTREAEEGKAAGEQEAGRKFSVVQEDTGEGNAERAISGLTGGLGGLDSSAESLQGLSDSAKGAAGSKALSSLQSLGGIETTSTKGVTAARAISGSLSSSTDPQATNDVAGILAQIAAQGLPVKGGGSVTKAVGSIV